MLDPVMLYDALYLLAAADGREAELFGGCQPLAREAFSRSLIGNEFPTVWFEVPLAGKPRFDLHVAFSRAAFGPGAAFARAGVLQRALGALGTGGDYEGLFRWYAEEEPGGLGLALAYDVSEGRIEAPAVHVNVNNAPLAHMDRFFELAAASAAVADTREAGRVVAASYAFAVEVRDANGATLEPADGQQLRLFFSMPEVADANLVPCVYELHEERLGGKTANETSVTATVLDLAAREAEGEPDGMSEAVCVETGGLSTFVVEFYPRSQQEVLESGDSSPTPAEPAEPAEPAADQSDAAEPVASTRTEVTATSATESIVGEVLANAVNAQLEREEGDGAEPAAELESYPTESHDPSYYDDSLRLRRVYTTDGIDLGYLVYRDTFYMVSEADAAGYDVTYSADKTQAFVTPAIDPTRLADKTGIVFLHESLATDVVLVFAEGQQPSLEGTALVVLLANTADLDLCQLFSDGVLELSGSTGGQGTSMLQQRLNAAMAVPRAQRSAAYATSLQAALGTQRPLNAKGAKYTPTFNLPEGTNWKVTDFSNISFDTPSADYKLSITDFRFALIVKLGGSFDFKAESTGPTNGKESKTIAGLGVELGLFNLEFNLLFEAQFGDAPVELEGRMGASMDMYSDALSGVSIENFQVPVTLTKFKFTDESKSSYWNNDYTYYLGSGFEIDKSFLKIDIDLGLFPIHFGPVVDLKSLAKGGTYLTARLEKDTYDPLSFSRTADSLHACAANGRKGCYAIHTKAVTDYNYSLTVDFYFKKWSHPFRSDKRELDQNDYYSSLEHATGLKEGHCPYALYRVPVQVLVASGGTYQPVSGMSASPVMDVGMEGVYTDEYQSYTRDTTGSDGRASLFLPYARDTQHTLVASGTYAGEPVVGSAQQLSHMVAGPNDEVKIYLRTSEKVLVQAKAVWDVDLEGHEKVPFTAVVQMRTGSANNWETVGWCKLQEDAATMRLLSDGGDAGAWTWSHEWPKYSLVNGTYVLNQFRVLQLRGDVTNTAVMSTDYSNADITFLQNFAYYKDLGSGQWYYRRASSSGPVERTSNYTTWLDDAIKKRAIPPDSNDPYADYQVEAYTDSRGVAIGLHRGTYQVSYATSTSQDATQDIQTTTITDTAVMDVDMNKVWKGVASSGQDGVYLALEQRPYDGWIGYAQELGDPTEWVTALEPVDGSGAALRDLIHAGVLNWANLYNIDDVPLAVAQVSAQNGWTANVKVRRFRNGIPLRFRAIELDDGVISRLLNYEYRSDQQVSVKGQWSGRTQPGEVYYDRYNARASAAVSNTTEDAEHTIGGSIFWSLLRDTDGNTLLPPEHVTIVVRDEDGTTVGSVQVNRSDFPSTTNGATSCTWTWSLTDPNIAAYKTYTIYEELGSVDHSGYWYPEVRGLDVYNHFVYDKDVGVKITAEIDSPSGSEPVKSPLKINLLDEAGHQIGTDGAAASTPLELLYDSSKKGYEMVVFNADRYYYGNPFASHDVKRFSIEVANAAEVTDSSSVICVYSQSVSYQDHTFPYGSKKYRVPTPTITFHAKLVVPGNVGPTVQVKWAGEVPSDKVPASVSPAICQDDAEKLPFEVQQSSGWTWTYAGGGLPYQSSDGRAHTYTGAAPGAGRLQRLRERRWCRHAPSHVHHYLHLPGRHGRERQGRGGVDRRCGP